MNYFRTVTAIMNYQITAEKSRKGIKEELPELRLKTQFNKVLDIFSIDIDKPIFGTHEERANGTSEIHKATLPELQKLFGSSGKKSGDSILLEDAGKNLNRNVVDVWGKGYKPFYDEILGLQKAENNTKVLRKQGSNVEQAEHDKGNRKEGKKPIGINVFRESSTEIQRKEAYNDILKTTLKLGAFGTNSNNVKALEEKLITDEEFRQTLYDTLIKRGAVKGVIVLSSEDVFLSRHKDALKNIKKYMKKIIEYEKGIDDFEKYLNNKKSIFNKFTQENKKKLLELTTHFLKNLELIAPAFDRIWQKFKLKITDILDLVSPVRLLKNVLKKSCHGRRRAM
jgi:hypothetical protein